MSGFHSSAPLMGALLASKGAAAPSRTVSSLLDGFDDEALVAANPAPDTEHRGEAPSTMEKAFTPANSPENSVPRNRSEAAAAPSVSKGRIKLSLRLEEEQHLRLKLAAAHLRQSSQAILLAALDDYLSRFASDIRGGDCSCLMPENQPADTSHLHYGEPHGSAD